MVTQSQDSRISRILQLVSQLTPSSGNTGTEPVPGSGDDLDCIIAKLETLVEGGVESDQIQEELRQNKFVVEHVSDAVYWIDSDGIIRDVNKAACNLFGYPREEFIGKSIADVDQKLPPEEIKKLWQKIKGAGTLTFETVHQTQDGRNFPVEVMVIHVAHDGVALNCAFARDITQRKQAEEALRKNIAQRECIEKSLQESQSVLRATLDSMQDGLLVVAQDGTVSHHNASFCQMWAIPEDVLTTGKDRVLIDYVLPQLVQPEQFIARIKAVYQSSDPSEDILELKDGRFLERTSYPLIREDQKSGRVWLFRDITEERQAAKALLESEHKFRAIVQNAHAIIFVLNSDGMFLLSEGEDLKKIGLRPNQVVGTSALDIYHDNPSVLKSIKKALAGELVRTLSEVDGVVFDVVYSPFYSVENKLAGVVGIAIDVTERRQAELHLEERNRLIDAVLENSPIGFGLTSIDNGRALLVSSKFSEIYGHPIEDIETIDKFFEAAYPDPVFRQEIRDRVTADIASGDASRMKWENIPIVTSKGERRLITATNIPLWDQNLMVSTVQDVTKRAETEHALRLSSFALEHTADAVYWIDKYAWIVDVNESACRMLGYTHEELSDRPLIDIDPKYDFSDLEAVWEIVKAGSPPIETVHVAKDGTRIEVEVVSNYVDFEGEEYNCCFVRDIRERKRAEEALRLNSFALERLSDAVYWINVTTIADVNDAACRMLGYSRDEFMGMRVANIDVLVDEAGLLESWEQVKKAGAIVIESQHRTKDGRIIPVEVMANYVAFEGKEFNCCFVRDITERKRAEEAIRLNSFALERSSDAVYWIDVGQIVDVNEAASRMLGYSHEELCAMSVTDLDASFVPENHLQDMWERTKNAGSFTFESQHKAKDGRIIPVEVMLNYVAFEGKEFNCCFVRDITERKKAEQALRTSEERLRQAVRNSNIGIFDHDHSSGMIYWSPELRAIFGWEADEDVSLEECVHHVHPDDREMNREAMNRAHDPSGDGNYDVIYRIFDRSGEMHWLNVKSNTLFEGEADERHPVSTIGAVADITERMETEARIHQINEELEQRVLERTQELEEANEEIRHFAYIVSHDLRAPLVNLDGFASELRADFNMVNANLTEVMPLIDPAQRDQMTRALQDDIPEALRFIDSAVRKMDTFTKAILNLSRLGRLNLELIMVDTRSLVEKTIEMLNYQIVQSSTQIIIGDLPKITADRVSMEQIFGNILTNAVTYLDPNRPGEIEISAEHDTDEIIFHIRDNGRGIAQHDTDKVFAPFRRAGQQDVVGEGMGLAYVQALVRRHGGRIWFESELGSGTTFSFSIPTDID